MLFVFLFILILIILYKKNKKFKCRQSPINIKSSKSIISSNLLIIEYLNKIIKANLKFIDNNYQYFFPDKPIISFNNEKFELVQLHFHNPSEHHIDNKNYQMEAHFVHKQINKDHYLVIGFLIEKGKKGPFDDFIQAKNTGLLKLDKKLLGKSYYYYPGSLTTNPYSSNVSWILFDKPIKSKYIDFWNKDYGKARKIQENSNSEVFKFSFN